MISIKNKKYLWYKNKLSLRCNKDINMEFNHLYKPPKCISEITYNAKIWSIPALIDPDHVVFGSWENAIHCVNIQSNDEKWRVDTDGPVYSSPICDGKGGVIVGSEDHTLRRLSPIGKIIWEFKSQGAFHSSPTIDRYNNNVYAGSFDNHIYCLDIDNGNCNWRKKFASDETDQLYSSPALTHYGDIIFAAEEVLYL
ncbi:PQQ-binding-like beta-propeller repeat protein [Vibrio sp. PP-XX7]